jgi:hypothetical protein
MSLIRVRFESAGNLPIRFKGIIVESVKIPQHSPDPRLNSIPLSPVNQVYSRHHAKLACFGIRLGILPNLPFLHNTPESAMGFTANQLPDFGQSFLLDDFIVFSHDCLLKQMKLTNLLFRKIGHVYPSFKVPDGILQLRHP